MLRPTTSCLFFSLGGQFPIRYRSKTNYHASRRQIRRMFTNLRMILFQFTPLGNYYCRGVRSICEHVKEHEWSVTTQPKLLTDTNISKSIFLKRMAAKVATVFPLHVYQTIFLGYVAFIPNAIKLYKQPNLLFFK